MSRSLHDMLPTSRVATKDFVAMPWRSPRSRHSLLLQMAQDAEKLAAQAERLTELKKLGRPTFKEIGEAIGITERQVQRWFAGDGDVGRAGVWAGRRSRRPPTSPARPLITPGTGVPGVNGPAPPALSLAGEPLAT